MNFSNQSISFLDIEVSLEQTGILKNNLFRKLTAGNTILRFKSAHPTSLHRSIPFSHYLRLRRICSNDLDFKTEAGALQDRLLQRGYPCSLLKKAYKRAFSLYRNYLLFSNVKKTEEDQVCFITTFNAQHGDLR